MKKYKVVVLDVAREDIRDARKWYNKRQNGLGKRLTADMANTVKSIKLNPNAFAIRYGGEYRVANFEIFPYAAHFHIDTVSFAVYITAIVHTSMHPDTPKRRI